MTEILWIKENKVDKLTSVSVLPSMWLIDGVNSTHSKVKGIVYVSGFI